MSKLLALNAGNTQMIRLADPIEMSVVEQKFNASEALDVVVYLPEYGENRLLTIDDLRIDRDGWGVVHFVGLVLESDGAVEVTLYDNEAEADPLNLK